MDKRRHTPYKKHKKTYRSKEDSENYKKVKNLARTYGMDDSVAWQIISGILPLEVWQKKQKIKKQRKEEQQEFLQEINKFSNQTKFSPQFSTLVLKSIFNLPEYRQQKFDRLEKEQKANLVMQEHNVSLKVAYLIASGKFTLDEYLHQIKAKEERSSLAHKLRQKYPDIPIESCYQILDDKITPEIYFQRKEESKKKQTDWYRNYLQDHFQDNKLLNVYLSKLKKHKTPITLYFFNAEATKGIVTGYTPYEIRIKNRYGEEFCYPKLKIKYFCKSIYSKNTLSLLKIDEEIQKEPKLPTSDRDDRYQFPQNSPRQGQRLLITLGESEQMSGKVNWFSKYDIKLALSISPKASVMIFRHAIVNVKILGRDAK